MSYFPILLFCLTAVPALAQISRDVTLTLVDEAGFNDFQIDLSTDIGNSADNSELSGTMIVRINLFPDATSTDEFTILSADIDGSDIDLAAGSFIASYEFTGENLGFSVVTTTPPGVVDFATGEFDASQHEVTINEGMLSGSANALFQDPTEVEFDFNDENFTGQGDGTGTVTITHDRIEGRKLYYEVSAELPTSIDQTVDIEDAPIDADIEVQGTVKAVGETFIEIPDYATWAAGANVALATDSEDNFDLTPANPNFILFSLGFDRQSAPTQLFDFSSTGTTLKVDGILAAGAFEIQWSNDLNTWERVPNTSMINGKSAFVFGDSLSEEITISKVDPKKYLRVASN